MYGFCIFLGVFVAVLVGERLCVRRGLDKQVFWRAVFYALVFGLLGARLYHILHRLDYFTVHLLEIPAFWQGGLGIWGAIFGGLLGFFLSTRRISGSGSNKSTKSSVLISKDVLAYLDIFAVCAPLAQAIGRWGNYFNKELFGYPTNLPWGIYIPPQLRPEQFKYYDTFHPLFFYESVLNLILFGLLFAVYDRQNRKKTAPASGSFGLIYLFGYSLIRFALEFLRPDPWKFLNFPVASIIAFVVFLSSLTLFFVINIKPNKRQHKKDYSA